MAKSNETSKAPKSGSTGEPSMSLRVEYVGIIAMVCLIIGFIVGGSGSFRGSKPNADANAFVRLGDMAYDAQAPKVAIHAYEEALKLEPGNADVLTDLGTMYLRSGDTEKAIANFKEASAANPKHAKSRFNLGIAYMATKHFKDAAEAFRQCLDAEPAGDLAPAAKAHMDMLEKKPKSGR